MTFDLTTIEHPTATVVAVTGELDIATAPQLVDVLAVARVDRPDRQLIVDLTATTFVDSTGMRTLANAARDGDGGHFSLVCPSENLAVHRLIELTGFDQVLVLHERLSDAGVPGTDERP
jgi:anti-sigma B factor antagonist